MSVIAIVLIGFFLPLFPLSIAYNFLLGKITNPFLKIVLLIFWPILGFALFFWFELQIPSWVLVWAVFTALLYAYRLITQRDINTWAGFLATSIWSLFWIPLLALDVTQENNFAELFSYLLGFGIPLALIILLANELKQRFGVAYTHLYNGLSTTMPRFSGLLIVCIFASIATPIFPNFFVMLKFLTLATSIASPVVTIVLLVIWLLWSWAGIRIIQGLVIGSADEKYQAEDLHNGLAWSFIIILTLLAFAGLFISGGLE